MSVNENTHTEATDTSVDPDDDLTATFTAELAEHPSDVLSRHMMRYRSAQIVCECGWHCARPAGPFLLSGEALWHLRDVVSAHVAERLAARFEEQWIQPPTGDPVPVFALVARESETP